MNDCFSPPKRTIQQLSSFVTEGRAPRRERRGRLDRARSRRGVWPRGYGTIPDEQSADKIAAGLEGDEALISGAQSGYATKVGILLARGTSAKAKNEALLALAGKSLPAIIVSAVDVQHMETLL
jgi:hypothetical protein